MFSVAMTIRNITKVCYSAVFGLILLNHLTNYEIKYIKYATSAMISELNLQWAYFFLVAFSALSVAVAFINDKSSFFVLYDILFFVYFVFVFAIFLSFYEVTNGCVDCHFLLKIFIEDFQITFLVLILLSFMYLFVIRRKQRVQPTIDKIGG